MSENNGNMDDRYNEEPEHDQLIQFPVDKEAGTDKEVPSQEKAPEAPTRPTAEMMRPYVKTYLETTFEKMRAAKQDINDYNLSYIYERPGLPKVEMVFYIPERKVVINADHLSEIEKDEYGLTAEAILNEVLEQLGE